MQILAPYVVGRQRKELALVDPAVEVGVDPVIGVNLARAFVRPT
jgi:hypothetical protein